MDSETELGKNNDNIDINENKTSKIGIYENQNKDERISKENIEVHKPILTAVLAAAAIGIPSGSLDKYEVTKAIGKGKFSTVYRAKRKSDDLQVALKKIHSFNSLTEKKRDKCLQEVKLLQSLSHPNIIAYLDSFVTEDSTCLIIIFEWAEAGDLKRQIRKARQRGTSFHEQTIWKYFLQIAEALQSMHEKRIMHRDLKPANIFLTASAVVKVGDLGLGRHFSESTLEAFSKVGTPLYMSPEVLKGKGYEWRSDIWSLGCILYELATLKSPFKEQGLNLYDLFKKICKGEYPDIDDKYSSELINLVDKMITVDYTKRPSISEVVIIAQKMRTTTMQGTIRENQTLKSTLPKVSHTIKRNDKNCQEYDKAVQARKDRSGRAIDVMKGIIDKLKILDYEQKFLSVYHKYCQFNKHSVFSRKDVDHIYSETDMVPHEHFNASKRRPAFTWFHFAVPPEKLPSSQWIRLHSVSKAKFVVDPSLPTQFEDFISLSIWLCSIIGYKIDISKLVEDFDIMSLKKRTIMSSIVLAALQKVGLASTAAANISPSALAAGYGNAVLAVTNWLCDRVLLSNSFQFGIPRYHTESDEEFLNDTHDDFYDNDDRDLLATGEIFASTDEAAIYELQKGYRNSTGKIIQKTSESLEKSTLHQSFIWPLDVSNLEITVEWQLETLRLESQLKDISRCAHKLANTSGSLERVYLSITYCDLIKRNTPSLLDFIDIFLSQWRAQLERISSIESILATTYEQNGDDLKAMQEQVIALEKQSKSQYDSLTDKYERLSLLENHLDNIEGLLDGHAEMITNDSRVCQIRKAKNQLDQEVRKMETRIGILMALLMSKSMDVQQIQW